MNKHRLTRKNPSVFNRYNGKKTLTTFYERMVFKLKTNNPESQFPD